MSILENEIFNPNDNSNITATGQQQNDLTILNQPHGTTLESLTKDEQPERQSKKREVYRHQTDWLISSVAWSNAQSDSFQLAVSSFVEKYQNNIQLVTLVQDAFDEEIQSTVNFEHPYPTTKILWAPSSIENNLQPQLLATTADYLRLWRVEACGSNSESNYINLRPCKSTSPKHQVKLECLLNPNKGSKHCAPLTSFDWNDIDSSMIVTSSVDTTCAVWDVEVGQLVQQQSFSNCSNGGTNNRINCNLKSQIVAHDHEVYDVSFSRAGTGRDIFVSCSGDGSVRLFDLRRLTTSSMLYEASSHAKISRSLVRVCCNKKDPNYVSFFAKDSSNVIIIDIRSPGTPNSMLSKHIASLNSMSWAPHSAHHICTAGDDQQALIWEISPNSNSTHEPLLAYRAGGKINSITWSAIHTDWIAIGYQNQLELLRV